MNASKSLRILIVDDEPDITTTLAWLLRYHGHLVEVVNDSRKSLQAIRDFHPQVVLLDIAMPHLSGYEVARQIRSDPAFKGLFVVALSAFGDSEHKLRAKQAGINHQMLKPVDFDALNAFLKQLVQGITQATSAAGRNHCDRWQTLTRDESGNLHVAVSAEDVIAVRGLLWAAHLKHFIKDAGTAGTDITFGTGVSEDAVRATLARCR